LSAIAPAKADRSEVQPVAAKKFLKPKALLAIISTLSRLSPRSANVAHPAANFYFRGLTLEGLNPEP